jgi:hypothetical protein
MSKLEWREKMLPVAKLKPFGKNPRVFTDARMKHLRESIERFGYAEPECVNTDMTVIGGHARLLIAKERGEKEIRCSVPSRKLTDQEVEELNVRLNANIGGVWDFDILGNEFELPDLEAWGAEEIPGFTDAILGGVESGSVERTTLKPFEMQHYIISIPLTSVHEIAGQIDAIIGNANAKVYQSQN